MIDTHAHLNFSSFNKDVHDVVRRFEEEGGEYINVVGAKTDSSIKAVEIAKNNSCCYATIGIHPHHIDSVVDFDKTYEELSHLAVQPKVIAIGETGIDYYNYKNSPAINSEQKEKQKQLFLLHLTLAHEMKLPLVIHCRNARLDSARLAQENLLTIINDFMKSHCITGVFHCFDGSIDYLETVLSLGFFIGFDGNITYKENSHLRELINKTPLTSLLLETDSPYLTPIPFRGSRNEPSYLRFTAQTVSKIKKEKIEKIIEQTNQNAKLLFGFNSDKIHK